MKVAIKTILLGLACYLGTAGTLWAHEGRPRASVTVWVGPRWVGPPMIYPGWPGPAYRPYPGWHGDWAWGWPYPYPYPPPMVVVPPTVYVERPVEPTVPPAGYWYWCPESQGWYPTVRACAAGWQAVLPRP